MVKGKHLVVCTNSAGDRKLYAVLVDKNGEVWRNKKERYELFDKKALNDCAIPLNYNGCDVYVLDIPPRAISTKFAIIYIQPGKEPSIYDQVYEVLGAKIPKEIPEKIKPLVPFLGHG